MKHIKETHFAPGWHWKTRLDMLRDFFEISKNSIRKPWRKHILLLGDTQWPPGEPQMKTFQTKHVPDIIQMVLQEKYKKNRTKKHKGNPFCPWVTLKDPPWEAQMKYFQTQNAPDMILIHCLMILDKNISQSSSNFDVIAHLTPSGHEKCPWGRQFKFL